MIYGIDDLRFYLIGGEAPWLENFQVLDRRLQKWEGHEVIFYALCTSHAVAVRSRSGQFTELLSCKGHLNMNPPLAEMAASRPFEMTTRVQGIRYDMRITIRDLAGNGDLTGSFAPENVITIAYPSVPGLDTPVTKIGWGIEPGRLRVETLHTYPESARAVRSASTLEVAGEAQI